MEVCIEVEVQTHGERDHMEIKVDPSARDCIGDSIARGSSTSADVEDPLAIESPIQSILVES
jgi:hypothetical protein